MKKLTDLEDLMVEQLRDLYHAEKELDKLLPVLIRYASDSQLEKVIDQYLYDNEGQIMRLRQVFELLYLQKRGEKCEAINAMVKEANDMIKRSADAAVMDAGIITALQHIIHYEIAGYGAICTYAKMLGKDNIAAIIHKNLDEEKKTDRKLANLAEEVINERAK
ncbi:MAG: DUF892 family protein [Cyclobacteriaceae bacterium]